MYMEIGRCDLALQARLDREISSSKGIWALLVSFNGRSAILDIGADCNVKDALASALKRCGDGRRIDGLGKLTYAVEYTDDVTLRALEEFQDRLERDFKVARNTRRDISAVSPLK